MKFIDYNKFSRHNIVLLISVFLTLSCGGSSSIEEVLNIPSNLSIEADIVGANPTNLNGDGSGTVVFSFSASNASLYKINLGNGEIIETSLGTITYTYTGSGTNTFQVHISAYNLDQFITKSITITIKINSGLLWSDEFNGNGAPDSSKWGFDIGAGGWGNNESQYYTSRSDNVIVEGGFLKITAKKESYLGAEYTSTRMLTMGKFDFTYGRVEVRAKLPTGIGTWPAIWMLGANFSSVGWPATGEIDIMEHVGKRQGWVSSAMHTPSSFGGTINHGEQFFDNVSTEFHIYSVEWTSEKMVFAVDGNVHYTYNPTTKNSDTWPYDANQFIILNIAMGGNFGGNIDPTFTQSSMEIDYVRVYQ
jgi:beta-glucanase (GH16 family)